MSIFIQKYNVSDVFFNTFGKIHGYRLLGLLLKYKTVVRFILTFLLSYFILAVFYHLLLDHYHSQDLPDIFTRLVALQTEAVISSFGYDTAVFPSTEFPLMNLYVNEIFIARIIEGCNSISIIILFISFMLAFFGKLRSTLLYLFAGSVIIYVMNILRIVILAIGLYELPQYGHLFHKVVFPLIIYGSVFLLWVIWIGIYSKQVRK